RSRPGRAGGDAACDQGCDCDEITRSHRDPPLVLDVSNSRLGLSQTRDFGARARYDRPLTAPTSSDALAAAFRDFRQKAPTFEGTAAIDDLRAREYGRLDEAGHVYLDYTGGGLYADSQLRAHFDLLRRNVFGNPHSVNPTSSAMTTLVESARERVLE